MNIQKFLALFMSLVLLCGVFTGCKKEDPTPTVSAEDVINTTALIIGDHKINGVEMNYFYVEMVNSFYREYGYYISAILDLTAPLNSQMFDEKKNQTWADYFLECSIDDAKGTYALYDAAVATGHTLSEVDIASVDAVMDSIAYYATYYKFDSTDAYLADLFGPGANAESYRAYYERNLLADNYYDHYYDSLVYDEATLKAFEGKNAHKYNSYSYATYFLSTTKYLSGGTEDSKGEITYTDAERKAAEAACKEAAQAVANGSYADVDAFNVALKAIPANSGLGSVGATVYEDKLYSDVSSLFVDYVSNAERKQGDMTIIPKVSGSEENQTVDGYYIVMHINTNDNTFFLKNVRHILVIPEGGTYNSVTGYYDYTEAEMKKAKEEAQEILDKWLAGKRTELGFSTLANEHSDDQGGNVTNGGLYENIFPGQMVKEFDEWCYAENRQHGDYEIIGTDFGYHIMFFSGDSEFTYRSFMLTSDKRALDAKAWYDAIIEKTEVTTITTQYVPMDMTLVG